MSIEIYTDYVNELKLRPGDRVKLKSQRGFNDKTIDTYKLKSLIPEEQQNIINGLKEKYGLDEVFKAGLSDKTGNVIYPLNKENILIPYLDHEGKVFYIRAHKAGLPDVGVKLYCPYIPYIDVKSSSIVLCEGEFKALALRQWGIAGLGLQGISTWTGKKFPELIEFLQELKKDKAGFEVFILFDTEDKNNPEHPKFENCKKGKPIAKYPNEFWSYILCYKLNKAGFDCKIASLPGEWMEKGKIDLDLALARGKKEKNIRSLLEQAKTHKDYLSGLKDECKLVVKRHIEKHFYNFDYPLREEFDKYYWITKDDKTGEELPPIPISNFTINLENTIVNSSNEMSRAITFKTSFNKSKPVIITNKEMNSVTDFKNLCSRSGDYLWTGKQCHLDKLIERLYIKSTGALIYKPDEVGKVGKNWLFGDCVIWQDGELQEIENKIASRGLTGYRLPDEKSFIPRILTSEILNIPVLLELLYKNLNYKSFLGIGWLVSSLMSDFIYKKERCFPLLFLFGKRQSGKNVYGRWLTRLTGMDTEGKSFQTSTPKGIIRSLSKLSNLPFWLNEYRNSAPETKKEFLLNVYGREGYVKAETSNDNRTIEQEMKGTLLLTGQETPKDNGIFSRCLILQFSEKEREDQYFEDINKQWDKLPSFTLQVIQKQENIKKEYSCIYGEVKERLLKKTSHDPRLSQNYSIVTCGFLALAKVLNYQVNKEEFLQFVEKHCFENKMAKDRESEVGEFWDMAEIVLSKESNEEYIYCKDRGNIYIWFSRLYALIAEHSRKVNNVIPFKEGVIKDYLKEEPYFIEDSIQKKIHNVNRKCMVLDEALFKISGFNSFPNIDNYITER